MFSFTFGDIGSGKSLFQAQITLELLKQSIRIEKKYKLPKREIWCNWHISNRLQKKYTGRWYYWQTPLEMIFSDYPKNTKVRVNFDCVWDEMAVELPSDKWTQTDLEIRRFFAQHRKRGIRIFGNSQDYMMVDINARRMATDVFMCHKIVGNRDPSATLPPVKHIWGIVFAWQLDKQAIRSDDMDRKHINLFPHFVFITRKLIEAYDTTEDIYRQLNLLYVHQIKKCATCGLEKVIHT